MRPVLLLLLLAPALASARQSGVDGYSGKQGLLCTSCHAGGTQPSLALTGPSALTAGQTATYTVTISGGVAMASGVNVALGGAGAAGAALTPGPGLRLAGSELVHSAPGTFTAGQAVFTFELQAPAAGGNLIVYVAGVSANANAASTGDNADSLNRNLTVNGSVAVDAGTPPAEADAGVTAPPVDPGPQSPVAAAPQPLRTPGGVVEGDTGCSATGGAPLALVLAAWALAVGLRRRRRGLAPSERPRARGV